MKKIALFLALLLILILWCVATKIDDIAANRTQSHHVSTTPSSSLDSLAAHFDIYQSDTGYTVSGRFGSDRFPKRIAEAFESSGKELRKTQAVTDRRIQEDDVLTDLVVELTPIFIERFQDGHIGYHDQKLVLEGIVDSYETKRNIQRVLNRYRIDSVDLSEVKRSEPMEFLIGKIGQTVRIQGVFPKQEVSDNLRKASPLPMEAFGVEIDKGRIDDGIENYVASLLPCFAQHFTKGEIRYKNGKLFVKGFASSQSGLDEMKRLISSSPVKVAHDLSIDPSVIEMQRRAQEEARRKAREEARKKAEYEARLKAQEEARKKAEQEALLKAREEARRKAEEAQAKQEIVRLLKVENIEFESAKSTLTPQGKQTVGKLARILKEYPHIRVEIAGHTDSDGDDDFNLKLSQSRVDEVKRALVKTGIDPSRIVAKGYGETRPIAPNDTPQNKQRNRRVEIIIIGE